MAFVIGEPPGEAGGSHHLRPRTRRVRPMRDPRLYLVRLSLILVLAGAAGWQSRRSAEFAYQIGAGAMKDTEIDPPKQDRKATLTVSSDEPVNVYVYLAKDRDAVLAA